MEIRKSTSESRCDDELDLLFSNLQEPDKSFIEKLRNNSKNDMLYDLLVNESKNFCCDKIVIVKELCRIYYNIQPEYIDQLYMKITHDLLINFNNKIIISFSRFKEIEEADKLILLNLLAKYNTNDDWNNIEDETDKKNYEKLIMSNSYRLRFEFDRNKAIRTLKEAIKNIKSIEKHQLDKFQSMIKDISHEDKDRIIDVNNTIKHFPKNEDILSKTYIFAIDLWKTQNNIRDFINYVEYALAIYNLKFQGRQEFTKKNIVNPTLFKRPKKSHLKQELWKEAFETVNLQAEWDASRNKFKSNARLFSTKTDLFIHKCKLNCKQRKCDLIFGFESESSFLYHHMKHAPFVHPLMYFNHANEIIHSTDIRIDIISTQSGKGNKYCLSYEIGRVIVFVSKEGYARILTFMPVVRRRNIKKT